MPKIRYAKSGASPREKESIAKLEARRAPLGLKIIAKLVDLTITGSASYVLSFETKYWPLFHDQPEWRLILATFMLLYFFLTLVPHWIFAQTIGEILLGIKLVTNECQRLNIFQVITRDMILFPVDLLVPWFYFKDKSLQDTLTNTQQLKLYEVRTKE